MLETKLDVRAGSRGSSLKPATAEHLYQPPPASTAPASTGAGDTQRLSAHTLEALGSLVCMSSSVVNCFNGALGAILA